MRVTWGGAWTSPPGEAALADPQARTSPPREAALVDPQPWTSPPGEAGLADPQARTRPPREAGLADPQARTSPPREAALAEPQSRSGAPGVQADQRPAGGDLARRPIAALVATLIAALVAALGAAGCAPTVDGPVEHQRAIDRDDGAQLAAQLVQLPGVVTATVVLHHALRDPLALAPPSPAVFSAVITTDDQAAPDAIRDATARLARAALPELAAGAALPIEIHATIHRARLARVGPFSVEDTSRGPLRACLAIACLVIAGLAGTIAWRAARDRQRRGSSAQ